MKYVIYSPQGDEMSSGSSNYDAWMTLYRGINTWANNLPEFRAGMVRQGYKCNKIESGSQDLSVINGTKQNIPQVNKNE